MPVRVGPKMQSGDYLVVDASTGRVVAKAQARQNADAAARICNFSWGTKKDRRV
jgi:hypothetical protein